MTDAAHGVHHEARSGSPPIMQLITDPAPSLPFLLVHQVRRSNGTPGVG